MNYEKTYSLRSVDIEYMPHNYIYVQVCGEQVPELISLLRENSYETNVDLESYSGLLDFWVCMDTRYKTCSVKLADSEAPRMSFSEFADLFL